MSELLAAVAVVGVATAGLMVVFLIVWMAWTAWDEDNWPGFFISVAALALIVAGLAAVALRFAESSSTERPQAQSLLAAEPMDWRRCL